MNEVNYEIDLENDYYTTSQIECIIAENKVSANVWSLYKAIIKQDNEELKLHITLGTQRYTKKSLIDNIDWDLCNKDISIRAKYTSLAVSGLSKCTGGARDYSLKEVLSKFEEYYPVSAGVKVGLKKQMEMFGYSDKVYKENNVLYFDKEFIDSLDFEYYKILIEAKVTNIMQDFMTCNFYKGIKHTIACRILNVNHSKFYSTADSENPIFKVVDKENKIFDKNDVIKWIGYLDGYVKGDDIIEKVANLIDKDICGSKPVDTLYYCKEKVKDMIKAGELERFNIKFLSNTPYFTSSPYSFAVKEEEEELLFNYLKNKFLKMHSAQFGTYVQRLEFRISESVNTNIPKTIKLFSDWSIDKVSRSTSRSSMISPFINCINLFEKELDKELFELDDDGIKKLLSKLETTCAREQLCHFLKLLQSKGLAKFKNTYSCDTKTEAKARSENDKKGNKEEVKEKKKANYSPYSEEQYLRFGFLVLSDSHIWYKDYLKKAADKSIHASVWLYCMMHYISAWRADDMFRQLPRPILPCNPTEFLSRVKNETLKDEDALDIVEQVEMKVKHLKIQPQKTKSKDAPKLVLEVPESLKVTLGTLIGLTEAHMQLTKHPGKIGLISTTATEKENQEAFFGEEFKEIFKGDKFNNIRAVKNYENMLFKSGEENSLGSGYVLASIARSHKFRDTKLTNTTMYYLRFFYDLQESEVIVRELFERGVCSFIPYMLAKVVEGEEEIKLIENENKKEKLLSIVPTNNYDSDVIVSLQEEVQSKLINSFNNIIIECGKKPEGVKESVKKLLKQIAYNKAPGKDDGIECISIAKGEGCLYPKRETCVGCGQEIYLKTALSELGSRISKTMTLAKTSKTDGGKIKNLLYLRDVLNPIALEMLESLKNIYGVNNSDLEYYKCLVSSKQRKVDKQC